MGGRSNNHQAASAVSAAHRIVPGPSIRKARPAFRFTSLISSVTASVKRTSVRLRVATTLNAGESSVILKRPSPNGPSAAPIKRKTATDGNPLLSMRPERSAETIMTMPIIARAAIKFSVPMGGLIVTVKARFLPEDRDMQLFQLDRKAFMP